MRAPHSPKEVYKLYNAILKYSNVAAVVVCAVLNASHKSVAHYTVHRLAAFPAVV